MSLRPTLSQPIWLSAATTPSSAMYARHEFIVSGTVGDAWIRCAASAPFTVLLNGAHLGFGLGPTLTPAPVWERFELTPLLHRRSNILLLFVAGRHSEGVPWLRAEGEIHYTDGGHAEVGTGPHWSVHPAPAWRSVDTPPVTSAFLATEALAGAERGRFPDQIWHPAHPVEAPEPREWEPRAAAEVETFAERLVRFGEVDAATPLTLDGLLDDMRTCKCVRRESVLRPGRQQALVQTRQQGRAVLLLLDFGRVLTAYPRLRLRGPAGGVVELGFAISPETVDSALRYVAREGAQEWISHHLQTCRYVAVRLFHWDEPLELDCVSLVERRVHVPTRNDFSASQDLSRIWETGHLSLEANRQEVYRTGPNPASPDWLTALALTLNGYALSGDYQTAAAMLAASPVPSLRREDPLQGLAYVLCLEACYRHSGNLDLIRSRLGEVEGLIAACRNMAGSDGLLQPGNGGPVTAVNAVYAGMLQAAARLARAAGDRETSTSWEQSRAEVRRALQQAWDPEAGLYADQAGAAPAVFSQWTNGLALRFRVPRPARAARIAAQIRSAKALRARTSLQAFCLADGLFTAGADRQAMAVIHQHWGQRLARGGDTWAEKWGRRPAPEPVGPEYFLATHILGVRPAAPGYRILLIHPRLSGLHRASGRIFTGRGPVEVSWRYQEQDNHFTLEVGAPDGGDVHLAAPRMAATFPTIALNGDTLWRNEKVYPNEHVREVIADPDRVILVLHKGGKYHLTVD